jgi:hypothetical protein
MLTDYYYTGFMHNTAEDVMEETARGIARQNRNVVSKLGKPPKTVHW